MYCWLISTNYSIGLSVHPQTCNKIGHNITALHEPVAAPGNVARARIAWSHRSHLLVWGVELWPSPWLWWLRHGRALVMVPVESQRVPFFLMNSQWRLSGEVWLNRFKEDVNKWRSSRVGAQSCIRRSDASEQDDTSLAQHHSQVSTPSLKLILPQTALLQICVMASADMLGVVVHFLCLRFLAGDFFLTALDERRWTGAELRREICLFNVVVLLTNDTRVLQPNENVFCCVD